MTSIRAIFGAARTRSIDEDGLRSIARQVTGSNSLKGHSASTYQEIINRMGPAPKSAKPASRLEGDQVAKIQALWIAAYNLGTVRNRNDAALIAFVKRMTKIDHMNWLHDPADANKVIEAIKRWIDRDHSIDWADKSGRHDYQNSDPFKVSIAILTKLAELGAWELFTPNSHESDLVIFNRRVTGKGGLNFNTKEDWFKLQNALGRKLRAAMGSTIKDEGGDK